MNTSIEAYLAFLWEQFQYDWLVFTNPWVLYTILPAILYFLLFIVKWYILLAPITIPITTFTHGLKQIFTPAATIDNTKEKMSQLLKG